VTLLTPFVTAFWQNKRILLTGHTGFKGAWLALWLRRLGAEVHGVSLAPNTTPNLFSLARIDQDCHSHIHDLREHQGLDRLVELIQPEIVFHLAAQALVRASYDDPIAAYSTNVMGTAHLLNALRDIESVKVAVMVTTDKVYLNREWPWPYREDDTLGGHDPYSASKAASELVIASYRDSFLAAQGVAIATARAGNVIGGGDWADDRLVPDAVRAWQAGRVLEVRRPHAIRPWQHVLEPLSGYLALAQHLWTQPAASGAYNFGPDTSGAASVRELVEIARNAFGRGKVSYGEGEIGPHEAGSLSLEVGKARVLLGVTPRWTLTQAVQRTLSWYRAQEQGTSAITLCNADIDAFQAAS
jgi:CDP-glucose 4,6-dehydratase